MQMAMEVYNDNNIGFLEPSRGLFWAILGFHEGSSWKNK